MDGGAERYGIDYAEVFQSLPGTVALLTPDLVCADADEEFLRIAGRTRAGPSTLRASPNARSGSAGSWNTLSARYPLMEPSAGAGGSPRPRSRSA